jgi:predicted ArsR family transcriptional regulator
MPNQTTRTLILEYLHTKGIANVEELSHLLHVTQANIRHHLSTLEDDGLVFVSGKAHPTGRGRPKKLYQLTQKNAEHNLDRLSSTLLKAFIHHLAPGESDDRLNSLAESIIDPNTKMNQTTNLSERLAKCILVLNDMHYRSRWEAHHSGPRIVFEHCPYRSIIQEHPEICLIDRKILELLLENKIIQIEKLKENRLGLTTCTFHVPV